MRSIILLLLCCLSACAQPYKPNSLNTNALGTNLVWFPATLRLRASGATPSIELWNTSGTANFRRFVFNNATDQLRFEMINDAGSSTLLLGAFSSDGNFSPVSLSLSGETNRLSIASDKLFLDGVPLVQDSPTVIQTNVTVITNSFTVGKGGTLIITNALTPNQVGASKVVGTAADGSLTNLDGVFTTRGSVLYRNATVWTALTPGTAGQVLQTGGAGADPSWATASGGLATSGSAYVIVGGSADATANWTALNNAYTTAKSATPHGAALSTANRYTIFLLPGKYDMGSSTLTMDTQYIDLIGLSDNTGRWVYSASGTGLNNDRGDTLLISSGTTINVTAVAPADITIQNLCLETTTASSSSYAIGYALSGGATQTGLAHRMQNVYVVHSGSANPKYAMQINVDFNGTFIDVRCWSGNVFGVRSSGSNGNATGLFIRCKASDASFGVAFSGGNNIVASGTFIDCEAANDSFGTDDASGLFIGCRWVQATGTTGPLFGRLGNASGTFINCHNSSGTVFGGSGGTMSGTARGCSGTAVGASAITGKLIGCDLPNFRHGRTLNVNTTTTGNVGGGTDNLITFTIPASTLGTDGDFIEFDCAGTFAATVNAKTLNIVYGATTLLTTTSLVLNGLDWRAHGKIIRTGATAQKATVELTVGGTLLSAVNSTITDYTTPGETLSGTVVFKCTGSDDGGSPADNAVVQQLMALKWVPAN